MNKLYALRHPKTKEIWQDVFTMAIFENPTDAFCWWEELKKSAKPEDDMQCELVEIFYETGQIPSEPKYEA